LQPLSEVFSGPTGLGFSQPHAAASAAPSADESSDLNAEEEEPQADDVDDIDETKPYSSLFREFIELRRRYFTAPYPADTIVEVGALALPGLMIEIEAVALVEGTVG